MEVYTFWPVKMGIPTPSPVHILPYFNFAVFERNYLNFLFTYLYLVNRFPLSKLHVNKEAYPSIHCFDLLSSLPKIDPSQETRVFLVFFYTSIPCQNTGCLPISCIDKLFGKIRNICKSGLFVKKPRNFAGFL